MKRLVLVSAALLAATVLPSTASADPTSPQVNATAQAVPFSSTDLAHMNVEVSCTATATPNALWTYVDACYLKGTGPAGGIYPVATTGGLPGPVDTAVGVKLNVPAQTYQVCVTAHGYFPGGVTVGGSGVTCF